MANGDLHKLGTFYLSGTKKARPTKPWRSDQTPTGAPSAGDIPSFSSGQTIEIRDTDANEAYKIQWREVNDGSKKLLISDRVLLAYISWDDLHAQSLVSGKTITIDGQKFMLRLLTAGSNFRSGSDLYSGGKPTSNEWDRIIVNEGGFAGLPTPTASDLDGERTSSDLNGAHNQFWNWFSIYSWGQETYTGNSANRAMRGDVSPRMWNYLNNTNRAYNLGWRPVLEVLNAAPTLTLTSPTDNQTLTEGKTYAISGTATDPDNGDVVTVKYKINNGTARAINSGVSDGSTPIPFAKTLTYRNKRLWDGSTDVVGYDLAEGTNHTLYVWAEDDKGGKSPDSTRTFTVTWNRPPVISGQDKDLGTINTPPSESFSVTDPENNPFTIEYYLDNQLFDSFAGVSGQTYTVSLTPDQWIRTSLTQHQLKVRAVDNQGAYSDRIFTFTRTEDRIEFTLNYSNDNVKNFFTTNEKANRILVTMDAVIPSGAQLTVEACNNAYDTQPTWEDITSQVKARRGYSFTNTTSTSGKWGINIHFKIEKGTATDTVMLNGFGGAFD